MKEGSRFRPDRFGPLRGFWAQAWWQTLRLSTYNVLGIVLGATFAGSYALSVNLAGQARDPRLKEYIEKLRQRMRDGVGVPAPGRPADESDGPRKDETYEMARQRRSAQEVWRNRQDQRQSAGKTAEDDMSPTGGAFQEDFMTADSDTGLVDDTQLRQQQPQPEYRQQARSRQNSPDNSSRGFDLDQINPTSQASDPSPSTTSARTDRKPSGGAWDRLRQNAMTSGQSTPTSPSPSQSRPPASGGARNSPTGSDSFSFSKNDEDQQLAKFEAQKQFDARIEKEREGKDFDDRGGGRSR